MNFFTGNATIPIKCFDLRHTFESAQPLTFHADYDFETNTLVYVSGKNVLRVSHLGGGANGQIFAASNGTNFAKSEIRKRFRLSDDMSSIYKKINTDDFMDSAIRKYNGMRVTLNDPWETTVCFIISQFNNVKRIRGIVRNIVGRYGEEIKDSRGNLIARTFPTSEAMRKATIKELFACGTGFRAKYLKHAAEYCTENMDLYKLNPNDYYSLKERLMEIEGVGDKVADCIALMGYGNLRAFPIDVWIKRTVERAYFKGKEQKIQKIHEFADEKWSHVQGYAQQYIFWQGRNMDSEMIKQLV